ncbi:zf-C2HC5-domain-containing protein [Patellaria atrata CBS 101060]|uniref:Zf-C2HC5-domain-containing protein n=1 Tax=Patellaria atrata CBS 101060 TaxID=1346257 RepID=A0A9P4VSF5_9PEZI|nr:zf-C2HC5-domain-containing protein [Patellaria atrata CBS 101060]
MSLTTWALPQLSRLLPIDEESLTQIITYTDTLSKSAAAEHLKNLLGDSPPALEFITSFNSRREVPKPKPKNKSASKTNRLPNPRRPDDYGNITGGYMKKDSEDYIASASKTKKQASLSHTLALESQSDAQQLPVPAPATSSRNPSSKPPPSAAGTLISDNLSSRTSSPGPKQSASKTKVNISGGTSMQGASSIINDLDSAIRALEIQTNPSLSATGPSDIAKRRCNCMATRHPLLAAAPNCLSCGKIICVKEGLGPCTFCNTPILSSTEIQSMVRVLREERGKEKMEANNASQRRAEVSQKPRPFSNLSTPGALTPATTSASASDSEGPNRNAKGGDKLALAQAHRDKLLAFQSQNARRTRIYDEAADFETPVAGQSMWASPAERALQLKRQQKVLREQEWNSRPEYEKRRVVASIDLKGGKVVRKMAALERPRSPEDELEADTEEESHHQGSESAIPGGTFSRNPLLGGLVKPVARESRGKEKGSPEREKKSTWRRVQNDDDNEQWILDGGAYGGDVDSRVLGSEERALG